MRKLDKKKKGIITTWIKPDVEQSKAVFHIDEFLTKEMGIIAGEVMIVTLEDNKLILERIDWLEDGGLE